MVSLKSWILAIFHDFPQDHGCLDWVKKEFPREFSNPATDLYSTAASNRPNILNHLPSLSDYGNVRTIQNEILLIQMFAFFKIFMQNEHVCPVRLTYFKLCFANKSIYVYQFSKNLQANEFSFLSQQNRTWS